MSMRAGPKASELESIVRQAHAEDVGRARALLDRAIADADAGWVPRNATLEALMALLADLSRPTPARFDA